MHILSLLSCTTERINKKIASRTKNCILALCWSFIMANSVLRLFLPSDLQYMVVVLCGTALLGVMLLLIFDRNACEGCWFRRIPLILTEVIGISFLFNGIYYRVLAYIAVGIIFSLLLPLLHRGIAAYGVSAFFTAASRGILISYYVLLAASLLCGPALSMSHYTAIFENANSLGDYLIVATMALLYLLNNTDHNRKKCVLYYAMLSSLLVFCVFSYSRTALLAILAQIVGYVAVKIILHIRNKKRTHIGVIIKKAGVILLTFLVTACVVYGLFVPVKKQIEQWLPSIQIWADKDGLHGGSFKDNIMGAGSYFTKGLDGNKDGNAGEDVFTSGRKGIWMSFAKEIKILGHASESREVIEVDLTVCLLMKFLDCLLRACEEFITDVEYRNFCHFVKCCLDQNRCCCSTRSKKCHLLANDINACLTDCTHESNSVCRIACQDTVIIHNSVDRPTDLRCR